ncbi:alpha/beta fold hydrolase [Duganella sp. BJB488]|uniref:esterase/lipase family protein n=1 Tax=unclassified Duganella TaxID=2636909 RepID=UPI000E351791|nr:MULTISPECIES: alpha/beta fold hydrolase [unclassified Duganella]RFP15134.1 alpha/beta fold hydrolase [Duganella sp. BJB489]RFP19688.1 alpha/beta fold hydrolase [Duganella sp. BJB488]RFP38077.1 alpha/beta fold hydrolase [Duganella sp. BJB480]
MIKRWIILLLLVQAGAALALAVGLHLVWRPAWEAPLNAPLTALAYGALGLACVLLVRMALSANNFLLSSRAGKGAATPAGHALNPARAAGLFLHEFRASMLASSFDMLRPLGMQLQPQARGLPVLLIHGYACNSGYWRPLSARLARASISHYGIDLEPPGASIDAYVPQVQAAIERLCAETGSKQVIIVGHSMGGLVARAWLRRHGADAVARVITLGTPHHGTALAHLGPGGNAVQMRYRSEWLAALAASEANPQRGLISSIYSVHDNIVAPQDSGALPGARNLEFGAIGHVALGRHPAILRCTMEEIVTAARL